MKISSKKSVRFLSLDRDLDNKEAIMEAYAQKLQFPDYFWLSWDSFNDCINDLTWLSEEIILIVHKNWLSNPMHKDNAYREIIESAATGQDILEQDSRIIIIYD